MYICFKCYIQAWRFGSYESKKLCCPWDVHVLQFFLPQAKVVNCLQMLMFAIHSL